LYKHVYFGEKPVGTVRLPRINDFDDPNLIPKVIEPLQRMADRLSPEELANLFLSSIYGYVNARCRAHARKLASKGITNISYENISSEVNWRLARSLYGIEWGRSPKEIKIYVVQQINFGLKEADRMAGKMTRREHRHVNKAATVISKEEQKQGRTLNRIEVEQIVKNTIKDTSKTKWSDIAINALDTGDGISKQQAPGEGNGLDAHGGDVVEVGVDSSAEEAWFTSFRFENLTRIIEEWVENDIRDASIKSGLSRWLDDQREPKGGIIRQSRAGFPPRMVGEISPREKKKLLDRCDAAGIDEVRVLVSEVLLSEMQAAAEAPEEVQLPF
jgi:hypothetical protein